MLVEYDGTEYHGFQWQANARTVQQELETAVSRLTGSFSRISGASRTDAGVHAWGQVASFKTESSFPQSTWVRGLNSYLPPDIAVRDARSVPDEFDVRRDAVGRLYRYRIFNSVARSPLRRRFAHQVAPPLDAGEMDRACEALVGGHDFRPFVALTDRSTWRTVFAAGASRQGDEVTVEMYANAFLPQQVRNTVGGLIRVGLGKLDIEGFFRLARSDRFGAVGPAAPPTGLCLVRVRYPGCGPLDGDWCNENV